MYLIINKWVIAVKVSNFSCHYLRNRSTLDIGVLGYIGIAWPKEHSPEVRSFPPGTSCIYIYIYTHTHTHTHTYIYTEQSIAQFCIMAAYHCVIKRPRTALTSLISLAVPNFHTLSHKGTFWKTLLNMKWVLFFTTNFERIIYCKKSWATQYHKWTCEVTVIIGRFSLKFNFHNRFLTNSE